MVFATFSVYDAPASLLPARQATKPQPPHDPWLDERESLVLAVAVHRLDSTKDGRMTQQLTYTVVLIPDSGQTRALVPAMPSIFTWGSTSAEALASAREAIELHLEHYRERGLPFPRDRQHASRSRTARLVTI